MMVLRYSTTIVLMVILKLYLVIPLIHHFVPPHISQPSTLSHLFDSLLLHLPCCARPLTQAM